MIHATEAGRASSIRILIDHREEASGLPTALRRRWTPVDQVQLDVGDIAIGPRVLLERKSLADFVASVLDRRLFTQAYRLIGASARPALLLEGTGDLQHYGLPPALIRTLKLSLALGYRLPVLRTRDLEASADLIVAIALREAGWWRRRQAWNARARLRPALDALMSIAGVGYLRAKHLLHAFGSVANVATAPPSALRRVAGIGPSTVAAIRVALQVAVPPPYAPVPSAPPAPPDPPASPTL